MQEVYYYWGTLVIWGINELLLWYKATPPAVEVKIKTTLINNFNQ
ncbi:MAG: hypothetical protein OHM56_10230 [Spiroplasma phoeniceum]|nr:MAG: hypothetical protein OHM57_09640 [Spiroplasma phoeniceum]UZQ31949.1 MAG: hypothetical protein OHM56_10230 [Spiroplasma phoeniceum]